MRTTGTPHNAQKSLETPRHERRNRDKARVIGGWREWRGQGGSLNPDLNQHSGFISPNAGTIFENVAKISTDVDFSGAEVSSPGITGQGRFGGLESRNSEAESGAPTQFLRYRSSSIPPVDNPPHNEALTPMARKRRVLADRQGNGGSGPLLSHASFIPPVGGPMPRPTGSMDIIAPKPRLRESTLVAGQGNGKPKASPVLRHSRSSTIRRVSVAGAEQSSQQAQHANDGSGSGPGDLSAFQEALDEYSNLDLTTGIVSEKSEQLGGGGFSDVFRSRMRAGWQARHDPHIALLFFETWSVAVTRESPEPVPDYWAVAVKRLRLWGKPIPKAEKVSYYCTCTYTRTFRFEPD